MSEGWQVVDGAQVPEALTDAPYRPTRSRERARRVLGYVSRQVHSGATWREVRAAMVAEDERSDRATSPDDWHHGKVSGALSSLHRAGLLERLADERGGSGVYVHPNYVHGRETVAYGKGRPALTGPEREACKRMRLRAESYRRQDYRPLRDDVPNVADDTETILAVVQRLTGETP